MYFVPYSYVKTYNWNTLVSNVKMLLRKYATKGLVEHWAY